jgi:4-carboxymuconolactone decarboxylase
MTDRMPAIPADQLTEAQKAAIASFEEGRGYAIRGPWVPLLRSPEVMLRAKAMGDYLRFKSTVPPRLSELAILITAREWTQQYEWQAHRAHALKGGLKAEIIDAIADGRRPRGMADDEEALYDLCTEILRQKRISDPTYAKAVVDILGICGYYSFVALIMNATRTALPEGVGEQLKRFPE